MKQPARPPRGGAWSLNWQSRAACRDADPELFFPVSRAEQQSSAALAVCAGCPVRQQCLLDELRFPSPQQHGVRGGMTAAARRSVMRSRTRRAGRAQPVAT